MCAWGPWHSRVGSMATCVLFGAQMEAVFVKRICFIATDIPFLTSSLCYLFARLIFLMMIELDVLGRCSHVHCCFKMCMGRRRRKEAPSQCFVLNVMVLLFFLCSWPIYWVENVHTPWHSPLSIVISLDILICVDVADPLFGMLFWRRELRIELWRLLCIKDTMALFLFSR